MLLLGDWIQHFRRCYKPLSESKKKKIIQFKQLQKWALPKCYGRLDKHLQAVLLQRIIDRERQDPIRKRIILPPKNESHSDFS